MSTSRCRRGRRVRAAPRPSGARSSARLARGPAPRGRRGLGGWWTLGPPGSLVPLDAEEIEQEQEDVEDVEEDARSDTYGAAGICSAQAVEVEDRERTEDPEPGARVDDVAVGNRDEDRDDPKPDEAEQGPEKRARPRGEVSARGVAVSAACGAAPRRGAGRLPQGGRVV